MAVRLMPTRVVRGEIVASESLSKVSMQADLTFRSLIVACDDYGRIDGRLPALKALLFPLREEVSLKKLDGWLDELAAGPDAPIVRYVVDGRPYVAMTGWEKHRGKGRRGSFSKCPEPLPRKSEEMHVNPPGNRESGDENRESGIERDPRGRPRRSACVCPDRLEPEARDRILKWARENHKTPEQVAFGWQALKDWSRSKSVNRSDWEAAFRNALRSGWVLEGYALSAGTPRSRYRDADQVIAEAKRRQAEDDARELESPEAIGNLIDLALHREASS